MSKEKQPSFCLLYISRQIKEEMTVVPIGTAGKLELANETSSGLMGTVIYYYIQLLTIVR